MVVSAKHEALNERLVAFLPELDSRYGRTPLQYRRWYAPGDTLDNGEPVFVPADTDQGLKQDYVYCVSRKRFGEKIPAGYYHLLTPMAHEQLFLRLRRTKPHKGDRRNFQEIRRLVEYRCYASIPDDVQAAREAVLHAQTGRDVAGRFGNSLYLPLLTSVFLLGGGSS